jgi:hypothetical protein
MPETDAPFNPLDSLGPEYGGINQPNADEISYKPFEGDRIKMPEINFSASPIPTFSSLTQPQLNIKNTITGTPPGKPGSKPGQSTNDIASAFIDYSKSLAQANQDKNSYARMYSYNAGPSGNNFFKRYNAYGQEKFDEIGFSPIRDNEAIFNERTTKWNDYTRMMSHSFMPLAVQGFMSGPKSLWKMAHGDFTSGDLEDAEMYEEASAIGQSTKGGAFGFMNNTFMNFGYTAGIITEIMAEEAGAALIGTGLTATGVGAPEGVGIFAATTARNIARIGAKAPMIGKFITKADDVFRGTVKALENSDTARAFWKASQTKVGSFLNPLSNTFTAVNAVRTAEKFDNLTGLAKMSKTAGGFYMDVKSINGALSEARLEAGMTENKVYQNLYDKYYKENGETPTNDQQYEMVKQSKLAGLETIGWNTALIYASNKISFGNILNRKGGLSKMLSSKTKEVLNLKTGNVVVKDVKAAGSKIVKGEFSFLENKFKNTLEILKTQGVAKLSKGAATYMKANIAEGLQENAQETISQALEGYYTDSFNSKAVTSHLYARGATMMASKGDYFSKAWGEQNPFTEKGFETFATGFVMGGFAAPLNSLPGWANTGYNRIFKPEEFAKYKEVRNTYGASVAQTLTDLSNDPLEFFTSKIFNLGNQEIMAKIKDSGSRNESLDATDQAFVSQISTALKTDTFDRFKDQLESYKNLTAEEFEAEFPSIPKGEGAKYIARIDGILTKANEIQKSYKEINDRFPSPIDLSKYEEGTDAYKKAAIFHSAWEGAKQNAIFMGQGYKDAVARIKQIKSTLQANKPLSKMTDTELQVLLEPSRLSNERELLRTEIESQRGILPAAEIAKKEVKLKALEDLSEAFAYYEKYEVIDKEGRIAKLKAEGRFKGLKDAQGNEITEAEAEAEAREIVNRSLKIKSRTKENTQEAQDRLESAYKNYLKAVASIHSDTYIERDADAAFELLLDSYKLGKEATILAGHVNMLHNPREFISHVEKNYTWMNDLYNNRREYYDGLVNQEINNIELNALLNELAEKNIYISADDAAEFQRSGRLPSEFFDETRKAVIKEGHPEYNIYAQLFERANSVRTFNPEARAADSTALNLALAKLNAEMQNEINSLPKTETIEELGKISLSGKESISIKVLDEQMEVEDFVDAEYMSGKKRKKVTFFKSKEGLRYDNQTGDLVNIERFSEKFVAGRKYKTSLKPDAAEVAKVEKVYAEKRLEIINKLNEKAKTEKLTQVAKYIPFTVNTPLEQMDDDLYTALTTAFSDYITDEDRENEVEQMNPEDLREILEDFIRTNPVAKDVIDNYNKKKIDQLISDQIEEIEAPVLNINGEVVNFELLDVKTIKSNVSKLEKNLEKLTNKPEEERTNADKEAIALLEFDLTLANKYLSYKLNIKDSPKRAAVLKKIRKLLDEQNDIELDRVKNKYIVKGKEQEFERVTNATQKLLSSHYKYPDTTIITEVYDATLGKGGTIDDFMKALRAKKNLKGFSKWTFTEIESELKTRLVTKRKATLNEVLALVGEKTYEDRRVAGIYVDAQIRNFLAGVEVKKDSTMIDDDAFDALFGPDSILSSLKEQVDNGDLIAIPNNIKLYDENSGIAGEIDLLFIDREGKVFIVDIKTGKKDKWDNYDDPENSFSPKQGYSLQLTAYKNMLYNMYGIEATIGVLPIQITTDSETGKVLTVKRADGVLKPDRGTFKVDANEESIVSIDANKNVNYGKTFQQLVDTIIPRITPTGETIEEVPLTPEDEEIKKEVKKLTAEQKKSQDRNMGILISKIQTLRERQALLDEDVSKINDTLKFLDTILNQSIDLTTEDVIGLINNITSLDKVTGQLIKSKLTKRGGKIQLRAKDLKAQLRREFAIANDITNRVKELKREKEQLQAIAEDLKKQGDYYQNLLDDPNMSLYNATEIKQKIDTVKRKISTIEKLITIIQNAISKSIDYLKEYVKIWETSNKNYDKFKKETGYKALSSEEIKSLIDSVDSADKATLENYPDLTKEFNKLESNVLDAMDSVELLEDVKAEETSRLNQLQGALKKYDDQLRYLNELLEPRSKDSLDNRLSDRNSEGPKPTEVKKASAENKKQTVEAIQRSKDDKVLSTFSLADIADLGDVVTGEQAVNKDLRSKLDAITKAKTTEEITELSKDLKDFKPGEIKMILDVVKERLQELTKEFKEEVKDQLDTTLGAEYVTINPIGDIPAGTLLVISEVVGDNVTVAIVNSNKKKSVKFGKLIGNVMTPAQAKESAVAQTINITKEVTDVLQTSKTAADNLSDSTIDKIIGDVDSLKLSDLEEDLFNMEIC